MSNKEFSLVSTVYNEMSRLTNTIADIEGQTLAPSEIVITDAGSKDGTYEELLKWSQRSSLRIVVLQKERCNVAEGRNLAIQHASHDLIVSTDFGCRFHKEWLQSILVHFNDAAVKIVGGNFSVLESELKSWSDRAAYICANGYRNRMDDSFLPSSRSIAYYKSIWSEVGGYPESLTLAADDTTFANRVKGKGYAITLAKEPYVYWLRPSTLKGYLKEAGRYATGDAEARDRQNIRNVIVNSAELILKVLFVFMIIGLVLDVIPLSVLSVSILVVSLIGFRSWMRIFKNWWRIRSSNYPISSLLNAFVFFDVSRVNYLYWYLRTLLKEPKSRLSDLKISK